MSTAVKIHVRTSEGEVEIEVGDPSSIEAAVEAASRIMMELSGSVPRAAPPSAQPEEAQVAPTGSAAPVTADLPEIKIEKGDSLTDIIRKMFETGWGRRPRKLSDVMEALSSFGLIYPKSSVAVALLRLAKDGEIRRFKEEGEYVYIAREPAAGG